MLKRLLFDTRPGNWLLAQLEARAGLSLVSSEWLGTQQGPAPAVESITGPMDKAVSQCPPTV